eukprot:4045487-Prymnesium_polylepis.1
MSRRGLRLGPEPTLSSTARMSSAATGSDCVKLLPNTRGQTLDFRLVDALVSVGKQTLYIQLVYAPAQTSYRRPHQRHGSTRTVTSRRPRAVASRPPSLYTRAAVPLRSRGKKSDPPHVHLNLHTCDKANV